ncbi:MAG TPA: DUF4239 domain-containing protein [Stellaceae bacterium]|nr:DUF4239 domain-containing protein [Stellaceae bacterium]
MIFLTTQPMWVLGILVALATLLAMLGPIVVRRRLGLEWLSTNNEVAGFKFATIGVLYAVLLGFAVIVVWEEFNGAETSVVQEAGAAATIYRLSDGIGGASGSALRDKLSDYLKIAIDDEWPAMERGRASPAATQSLDRVYAMVLTFHPADLREAGIQSAIVSELGILTRERRDRLVRATGIVPDVLWLVLFGGAALTVGFTFFFGTRNLRAQTMMTGMLAVLVFGALFVVIVIDHPFSGSVKVTSDPLAAVLADFAKSPP